ncbi:hypothetical protein Tco_1396840 [Tanacetum coccineum]
MSKKALVAPSKKSSITTDDNILPDPDEALKLGKSINITEVEIAEEERQVHETHERLVTKKTASDKDSEKIDDEEEGRLIQRRPTGVVIGRPVQTITTTKSRINLRSLKGSNEEVETISSSDNEEHGDEEVHKEKGHDDEEFHADDEAHDDKYVHDDDEKHDADERADEEKANEEMNVAENVDEAKDDQEMADAEKINAKTPKEEKDDQEHTGDDLVSKYDQADVNQTGALIPGDDTQMKMPELPPSSSSLSLSSNYENPFVQQNTPLDILVSVIPEQATPPPITSPTTTEAQADPVPDSDPSTTLL